MIRTSLQSTVVAALAIGFSVCALAKAPALPKASADIDKTSVSGLSSGAFMTSQLFMAHSSKMVGAGVIAGGPYLCSLSSSLLSPTTVSTTTCMNPPFGVPLPNTSKLVEKTNMLVKENKIDPLDSIPDANIYIFSGSLDPIVKTSVVNETYNYFVEIGVPSEQIRYNSSVPSGHAVITNNDDNALCAITFPPYINNCDIDQADRLLEHIYGELKDPVEAITGQLLEFDQTEFLPASNNLTAMAETGFVYIPESCEQGGCPVHVAVHGCGQSAKYVQDAFYQGAGYNEVADSNGLIILYPQVNASLAAPLNPLGCWDFWGYSIPGYNAFLPSTWTADFATKDAPQIKAIFSMVERLSKPAQH